MRTLLFSALLVFGLCSVEEGASAESLAFGVVKAMHGDAHLGAGPLKLGMPVALGQVITTGPKSFVRLLLAEGIALQIGPLSSVKLEKAKDQTTVLELSKGYLLSRIKPSASTQEKYRVETKGAAMGVRGTTFFAKVEADDKTFLCVCEGKVAVSWAKGKETLVSVHHDAPKMIVAGKANLEPAEMGSEHTDADIGELKKLLE